ncbi:hypothetical protein QFC21_004950 [Naganishia friedmannii]|uniref:Uncharacterized protein n=1 Tax=Naganishia friedmannii TaxID=89922 RepID=A0ACC2VDY4_9TREE|nr:hypothetical protein QFC21_004950 [Naganishia friedmannii]
MDVTSLMHAHHPRIEALGNTKTPEDIDRKEKRERLVTELENAYLQCEAVKRRLVGVEEKREEMDVMKGDLSKILVPDTRYS